MLVDLRQYTLHPGRRDDLIDVFDEYFVEGQEASGMQIVGQFRDLDRPDRFVWLRAFPDYETRGLALNDFYGGPIWKAHSRAANETMLDSDNALLLTPLTMPDAGAERPPIGAVEIPASIVAGAVYHRRDLSDGFADYFHQRIEPALTEAGARPIAVFETFPAENNFPGLPLRDETVLVWLSTFADSKAYDAYRQRIAAVWRDEIQPEIDRISVAPAQHLRLSPTARSGLR